MLKYTVVYLQTFLKAYCGCKQAASSRPYPLLVFFGIPFVLFLLIFLTVRQPTNPILLRFLPVKQLVKLK